MRCSRLARLVCSVVALVLAIAIAPLRLQAADELEQHLRDQYGGKTLVLRNFYHRDRLGYNSAGSLASGSALSGDWTVDGFVRVKSLDFHGHRLTIQAERLSLGNTGQSFQFQQYFEKGKKKNKKNKDEEGHKLRIEVEFDAGPVTAEKTDAALSRIFLIAQDRFEDFVPAYWKPCIRAASRGKGEKPYDACRFPPEFATIPGVLSSAEEEAASETQASEGPIARIGKGVTPPKPVFSPDPEFSEPARSAKYQGAVVLLIAVDKQGKVRNIRIANPLGFGLDEKAVETVARWRFNPAKKDGEPVDAELAVEVDFHLY